MSGRWYAACLVLLVLGAGCARDPEPRVEPTPTPASNTSSHSQSSGPERSENADPSRTLIKAWINAYNGALGGEFDEFARLSAKCPDCMRLVDRFKSIHDSGGEIRGGSLTVRGFERLPDVAGLETWLVRVEVEAATYTESDSSPPESLTGGTSRYRFVIDSTSRVVELYVEAT